MQCPKCHTDMKKIEYEGVEVDRCYNCYGIWFDFQEQQQLKGKKGATQIDGGDLATGQRANLIRNIYCPRDGALMTPMLILLFHVKPVAAISSDLAAAVVMRPVGSLVHMQKGTVSFRLVGLMCLGSVPMAFLGTYLLHVFGGAGAQQQKRFVRPETGT